MDGKTRHPMELPPERVLQTIMLHPPILVDRGSTTWFCGDPRSKNQYGNRKARRAQAAADRRKSSRRKKQC